VVSGVVEYQRLYDPEEPVCEMDVEPLTWVEFAESARGQEELGEILRQDHRAYVTFRGVLWGPGKVGDDDRSLPVMVAYAERISGRRYGRFGAHRTRLVVEEVLESRRVPATEPSYRELEALRPQSPKPIIIASELPRYPPAAQKVGIEGEIVLDVRIENGRAVEIIPVSGDRILIVAAEENIKSWRLDPSVDTTFRSTFIFELELRRTGVGQSSRIQMELPQLVRISAPFNGW
jgi:hypothetical protein